MADTVREVNEAEYVAHCVEARKRVLFDRNKRVREARKRYALDRIAGVPERDAWNHMNATLDEVRKALDKRAAAGEFNP
jgi:hypothetical protein